MCRKGVGYNYKAQSTENRERNAEDKVEKEKSFSTFFLQCIVRKRRIVWGLYTELQVPSLLPSGKGKTYQGHKI